MSKAYDATTKELIERHPRDWLALAGLPVPPGAAVRVVDADLSTFTTAADKVIEVGGPEPYLGHIELQSGSDDALDLRVLVYNSLLRLRRRLPVRSVVFLLRPAALPAGSTTPGRGRGWRSSTSWSGCGNCPRPPCWPAGPASCR